jgi:hypothetical protein
LFVYCLDDELKRKLLKNGFKLLNEYDGKAVFLFEKSKFDFEKVDKSKFLITNKLNFVSEGSQLPNG